MRRAWLAGAILAVFGLLAGGCVYCPWLAKAGDVDECEGNVLDNIDGKDYRLTLTQAGTRRTHSATLNIERGNCSVTTPQDLVPFGVEGMRIKHPRSASKASFVIYTELRDADGEPIACSAALAEFEPLDFICPPQAKGRRYKLEPIE